MKFIAARTFHFHLSIHSRLNTFVLGAVRAIRTVWPIRSCPVAPGDCSEVFESALMIVVGSFLVELSPGRPGGGTTGLGLSGFAKTCRGFRAPRQPGVALEVALES